MPPGSGRRPPGERDPERELVPMGPGQGIRCFVHDYPHPLARWHFHPEIECHLITESSGTAHIGASVRVFEPGSVYLIGSDLPHNWVSALPDGQVVPGRDVLVQADAGMIGRLCADVPELAEVEQLLAEATYGLEFTGRTRRLAAEVIREIQDREGPERFALLARLLAVLAAAPEGERVLLDPSAASGRLATEEAETFERALGYLSERLREPVTLTQVARHLRRSPTSISRLFTRATTVGFSRTLTRMRVSEACRLLRTTTAPIGQICWDAGFSNASNFNRRFKEETGMTPREYRAHHRSG